MDIEGITLTFPDGRKVTPETLSGWLESITSDEELSQDAKDVAFALAELVKVKAN
jgi:hypothetical protein